MKTKKIVVVALMAILISSCAWDEGGSDYPKSGESNAGQITGYVISKSLDYDKYLGYKVAVDENNNGVFEKKDHYENGYLRKAEHYVWIPNDIYNKVIEKDSIVVKAVHFQEDHFLNSCDAYIVFDAVFK